MLDKQSIFYKIPIEKYKEVIDSGPSKDKKQEILDLFINNNHLFSEEEYDNIKYNLHAACYHGDVELIKILLRETIESNKLIFKIDKTNQTASLFKVNNNNNTELIIPRTVEHESTEYIITNIIGINNTHIKTMKFSEDSAVKTIYGYLFSPISKIEEIYFPASLRELKPGWCYGMNYLYKNIISPLNGQINFIEDKYLVGKSDSNNDEFDTFLFAPRNIKAISIPSNIKIIKSYAFHSCYSLRKLEIPTNSNLQTIEPYAFSDTKIGEIYFPASLKELKNGWCYETYYLNRIKISPLNGQFKLIEDNYLIGKSDLNKDEFDTICFARRHIKEISIPSNIRIIALCAFQNCNILIKVEIPTNSNLQTIEPYAFSMSCIKEIFIPPTVTKICQYAFNNCYNLQKVEIPLNSNLHTIESYAFSGSRIEEIYFPASLKELKEGWCYDTKELTKIKISPSNGQFKFIDENYLVGKSDSNKDEFDTILFARRDIVNFFIPSNIKIVAACAFDNCKNLTSVEISTNSNLQTIELHAFSSSKINKIFIPSKVSIICEFAFLDCKNLEKVEIPTNSNLQTIELNAFSSSKIDKIFIPSKVSKIGEFAFSNCKDLAIIEIAEESKLKSFPFSAFPQNQKLTIMIPSSLKYLIQ